MKTRQNSSLPTGQDQERFRQRFQWVRAGKFCPERALVKSCLSYSCFIKMALSLLIMVQFETLKNWLAQESQPVLQTGLRPRSARPEAVKPISDRRTSSIFYTDLCLKGKWCRKIHIFCEHSIFRKSRTFVKMFGGGRGIKHDKLEMAITPLTMLQFGSFKNRLGCGPPPPLESRILSARKFPTCQTGRNEFPLIYRVLHYTWLKYRF